MMEFEIVLSFLFGYQLSCIFQKYDVPGQIWKRLVLSEMEEEKVRRKR